MQLLFHETSENHEIKVYDTTELYGEKGSFRVLEFSNQAMQGALDLNHPQRILFEYPRAIIHLMEYNGPDFEDAFLIGHGIGTIAGYFADRRFKVAELDRQVVELSRAYFGSSTEQVMIGDGRELLKGEEADRYDFVIVDAFTEKGTPRHLISREFFRLAAEKLHPDGAVIMNLIGRGTKDKLIQAIHTTLSTELAYTKAFFLPAEKATDTQNVILMGGGRPIQLQERHMAGFQETRLGRGHVIKDR
ncbi:fused MFS/spermidine synthase [Paenibacillus sp. P96]|uniref:Fused MFS/spermidine synthase n=1 Tax=Paenibacillus zeirhizosphaerae TaxID=2987519 RepID=A0ABT9FM47_9BACL|nr:fused MFS/spermidine synthase [Paenibacillus sp. P96]MDP4095804.1 fused MFS/spermidine synthase [Paenibacillus sp. P96]